MEDRQSILRTLRKFALDRRANVAVIFAVSATVLLTAVAGGIDYSRSISIGVELQSALDSGVLAAASLSQDRDPEAVVRSFVSAALEEYPQLVDTVDLDVESTIALNSRQVAATASLHVPTTFLGMTGIETLLIQRQADAIEQVRNIEISLVLDISSSMGGLKIDNLRVAALDFVDTMLESASRDMTSISVVPYGGTVRLPAMFFDYVIQSESWYEPSELGYKVRLPSVAADWNGCLEMTQAQAESINLTPAAHGVLPDFTIWTRGNNWCPPENTPSLFLTNDRDRLHALIGLFDNPVLSDGTGTDVGTGWGVRALDPIWRGRLGGDADFSDRPVAWTDPETIKVMVVMTDGGITQQLRPKSSFDEDSDDPHVRVSGAQNLYVVSAARNIFQDMCSYAKDRGAVVYTIAFQVGGGQNKTDMRNCASSAGQYYDVESLDIAEAFSSIAAEINQLRLSR